jgi:hypothetical protein
MVGNFVFFIHITNKGRHFVFSCTDYVPCGIFSDTSVSFGVHVGQKQGKPLRCDLLQSDHPTGHSIKPIHTLRCIQRGNT